MKSGVLASFNEFATVRLEACTFESNTVLQHITWQKFDCGDIFYSDSSLNVWCAEKDTTSKTLPLAALPADRVMLTAETPYLTGLQQVCIELMPYLHGATKSLGNILPGLEHESPHGWSRSKHTTDAYAYAC
jgi:hypothetical protein